MYKTAVYTLVKWSVVTIRLSGTVIEIFSLEDIRVATLTFCGHVTDDVT